MKLSYGYVESGGQSGGSYYGELQSIRVSGDEFEVSISQDGVCVYPKRQNTIPQHPIFVLPLPLPPA